MFKRKIVFLEERIKKIEDDMKYLIDRDTQYSKKISEELILKNNCENAFKQGEESERTALNKKIDKLIEDINKSKSRMFRKTTIINQLKRLKF